MWVKDSHPATQLNCDRPWPRSLNFEFFRIPTRCSYILLCAHSDLIKYESTTRNIGHARTYWCACNPAPTPPALLAQPPASQPPATFASTPSSTPPTIKRTQSTLTSWLSKPAPPSGMQVSRPADLVKVPTPPPGCGGTITVSVVEDASHPLASMGIKGQRIAVRVEHPGRDVNKSFAFE